MKVVDRNGSAQLVDPGSYDASLGTPGRIRRAGIWPRPATAIDGVHIDFTAGWSDAASVPDDLKQAIKLLAAGFYENREAAAEERIYNIPGTIDTLIAPYRQVRL